MSLRTYQCLVANFGRPSREYLKKIAVMHVYNISWTHNFIYYFVMKYFS